MPDPSAPGCQCMPESPDPIYPQLGREIGHPIRTINLPVSRASSVVFDSFAEALAAGAAGQAGDRYRASYATSGTELTHALFERSRRVRRRVTTAAPR